MFEFIQFALRRRKFWLWPAYFCSFISRRNVQQPEQPSDRYQFGDLNCEDAIKRLKAKEDAQQ
jgi:hypothetical protein